MSGLHIFISHSAKTDAAKTLLHGLSKLLNKHGHRVLLDQDGLSPGKNWYNILNWWMNNCDTALVLLSKDALKSKFVAYEVSILTYRLRTNPKFRLFPILVPGEIITRQ